MAVAGGALCWIEQNACSTVRQPNPTSRNAAARERCLRGGKTVLRRVLFDLASHDHEGRGVWRKTAECVPSLSSASGFA